MPSTNDVKNPSEAPTAARSSDVIWGVGLFLAINFLIAAYYFHIII